MYNNNCPMCLGDDLTDAEALEIIKEEFNKLNPITIGVEVAKGDYSSLHKVIKASVERICIQGTKKKLNNVYVWVGGAVAVLLLGYLIMR